MIAYPFEAGGAMTRLLSAGPQSGEPMILLHGVGARADRWRNNVDAFAAAGFRVFAVDLPGHGFASKGADFPYGVRGYADFVTSLMDELRLDRATLVGTSLGAHVAAKVVCMHPERVDGLILVGAVGLVPMGSDARHRVQEALADTSLEGIGAKLRWVIHDGSLVTDDWVMEEFAVNNSPGAKEAFERLGAYFGDHLDDDVVGEELAGLKGVIPILLVWGDQDRTVPIADGRRAAVLLDLEPIEVIPRTGHAPYLERPEVFNELCLRFLASR